MWTYYFVVIYAMIIAGFMNPAIKENKKEKLFFVLVPIFIYAAIRGNGNGDYFNYINRGKYINSFSDVLTSDIGMEIGYKIVAFIIKNLGLPRQSVIIVFNMISAVCLNRFLKKYSTHWTLSMILYFPIFFQFEMHAARTGVAISIVFWGMEYIEKRQFLKFLIIVLIATSFHTTAIVALLLYWIYNFNIKKEVGIFILLTDVLFSFFISIDNIVMYLLSTLNLDMLYVKYITYSNSKVYGYAMELYDPRIIMGILIYIVCSSFIVKEDKTVKFSINCIFLYILLLITFREHTFIAYRLSSYFYYPIMVLIPKLILDNRILIRGKEQSRILIFYSVLFMFSALSFVYASQNPEYIVFWKNGQALNPW